MSQIVQNLSDISDQYEALFVDLWGCVHNGVEAYPAANEALIAYRKRGGKVVLACSKTCGAVNLLCSSEKMEQSMRHGRVRA